MARVMIKEKLPKELLVLVKDELNVKEVVVRLNLKGDVQLDTKLTPQLKEEGQVRELLRHIQDMRKDAGYRPQDKIMLRYSSTEELNTLINRHKVHIQENGGIEDIQGGERPKQVFDIEKEVELEGNHLWFGIKKA